MHGPHDPEICPGHVFISAGRVNTCSDVYRHTSGSLPPALSEWLTHLSLFFFNPAPPLVAPQERQRLPSVPYFYPWRDPSRRLLPLVQLCFARQQHVDPNESLERSHSNWAKRCPADEDASSQSGGSFGSTEEKACPQTSWRHSRRQWNSHQDSSLTAVPPPDDLSVRATHA